MRELIRRLRDIERNKFTKTSALFISLKDCIDSKALREQVNDSVNYNRAYIAGIDRAVEVADKRYWELHNEVSEDPTIYLQRNLAKKLIETFGLNEYLEISDEILKILNVKKFEQDCKERVDDEKR